MLSMWFKLWSVIDMPRFHFIWKSSWHCSGSDF